MITYSPYFVTSTSANGSAVYWSLDTDENHGTSIQHCLWLKFFFKHKKEQKFILVFVIRMWLNASAGVVTDLKLDILQKLI